MSPTQRSREPAGAASRARATRQLRRNMRARPPRRSAASAQRVVDELPDWEALREAGRGDQGADAADTSTSYLVAARAAVTRAGGTVHWARDARRGERDRRRRSRAATARRGGQGQVADDRRDRPERGARSARASTRIETDLAELIIQLAGDRSSHILVPAIHRNRSEIRDLFRRTLAGRRSSERRARARWPRRRGAPARAVPARAGRPSAARTSASPRPGTVCVVESEGNGRMCLTLPAGRSISVMGIEKVDADAGRTSRSSCSCCRAPRPASG